MKCEKIADGADNTKLKKKNSPQSFSLILLSTQWGEKG